MDLVVRFLSLPLVISIITIGSLIFSEVLVNMLHVDRTKIVRNAFLAVIHVFAPRVFKLTNMAIVRI